ncbi:MAG: hypothetical protein K2I10_10355 [Lachnospiraceae bacterium]|nr:hypothetical protein [Lachnospiraceae bacterium]
MCTLYHDIENLNEITHAFSIVAIKDTLRRQISGLYRKKDKKCAGYDILN